MAFKQMESKYFVIALALLYAINFILLLVLVYHSMLVLASLSLVVQIIITGILIYREEDSH